MWNQRLDWPFRVCRCTLPIGTSPSRWFWPFPVSLSVYMLMDPHKCLSRCLVSSPLTLSLLSVSILWDFPTLLVFDVSIMPTEVHKKCTVVTQNWTCALSNIWVLRCFDFLQSCLDAIYTSCWRSSHSGVQTIRWDRETTLLILFS